MPIYCYQCPRCKRIIERAQTSRKRIPKSVHCECGFTARRNFGFEHRGQNLGDIWQNHQSLALAVAPAQIKAQMEEDKKRGVPVEYRMMPDGLDAIPVLKSAVQKRKYMKAYGFQDKDAYL